MIKKVFLQGGFLSWELLCLSSLQKGDLFTTETTEITETKDNFIFHKKNRAVKIFLTCA
jgi:hypothetical protein